MKRTEVELIPWTHAIDHGIHGDAINYIKTIPKNSFIVVEATAKYIEFMNKLVYKAPSEQFKLDWQGWAYVELVHECKKRNITVIPIESLVPRISREREIQGIMITKKDVKREKAFARNIQTLLKRFNVRKLYALTGAGHTPALKLELKRLKIKAKINTIFVKSFKERTKMKLDFLETRLKRKAVAIKRPVIAKAAHKIVSEIGYYIPFYSQTRSEAEVEAIKNRIAKELAERSSREYYSQKRQRKLKFRGRMR